MSDNLPKSVFPVPYQVDFSVESKGRHLDSTKRRIKWKFGFAHPPTVFPHLHDDEGKYIGSERKEGGNDKNEQKDDKSERKDGEVKTGVDCRGREHELVLTWSIITGKASIWVDNKEIYRSTGASDTTSNPLGRSFYKGFDLPNPKFNGRHRLGIRCYARTPLGAKNMAVDQNGATFRQYDLTVDGLSYFAMPAMFELGTDRMWAKVSNWGLRRLSQENSAPRGPAQPRPARNPEDQYFNRPQRSQSYDFNSGGMRAARSQRRAYSYDQEISNAEYRAMNPKTQSEEEKMLTIAMQASLEDQDADYSNDRSASWSGNEATNSDHNPKPQNARRAISEEVNKRLSAVREDENLIDFGADDLNAGNDAIVAGMSSIQISNNHPSDVSVLGDDDATTASFVLKTAWNSTVQPNMVYAQHSQMQQPAHPPMMHNMMQQPMRSQFQDPTFSQNQWGNIPNNMSPAVTPRGMSDASFAVPPPPTWDDYNYAFGGSMAGNSVAGSNPYFGGMNMSNNMVNGPMGNVPPVTPTGQSMPSTPTASFGGSVGGGMMVPSPQQYGMPQYTLAKQGYGGGVALSNMGASAVTMPPSPKVGKDSKFDPLRSDPFAT